MLKLHKPIRDPFCITRQTKLIRKTKPWPVRKELDTRGCDKVISYNNIKLIVTTLRFVSASSKRERGREREKKKKKREREEE